MNVVLNKALSKEFWTIEAKNISGFEFFEQDYYINSSTEVIKYTIERKLNLTDCDEVRKLCNNSLPLLYNFYSSAFSVLLYKYFELNEISFISPYNQFVNIPSEMDEYFMFKSHIANDNYFKSIFSKNKEFLLNAFKNKDSINNLQQYIDTSKLNALKEFGIVLNNKPYKIYSPEILIRIYQENGFDILKIECNSTHFSEDFLLSLIENFKVLLSQIIKKIYEPIENLDFLNESEKLKLKTFNQVDPYFPINKNIIELIEEQVITQKNKIAVVHNNVSRSYNEVWVNADKIAKKLKSYNNIHRDSLIGILMDRSINMLESILGVWMAGAAYVPIDKNYPTNRITQIFDSASIVSLITDDSVREDKIKELSLIIPSININQLQKQDYKDSSKIVEYNISHNDLAYVMFTSGSTGKPKGVMIEHFGMINHIGAKITELNIDSNSIVSQNATHTFDISVWQFFSALVTGGTTIIYDTDIILQPSIFIKKIEVDKISVLELVPSYLIEMLEDLEENLGKSNFLNLKILVLNAETLMPSMVKRWLAMYPYIPIVNTYGITEVSDDVSHYIMYECPNTATVPVLKKPIQNFEIHIVNKNMQLAPIGVKGEILLSGPAVGRGYLNDADRTKLVFLKGPINGITDNRRVYKTGDIGRYLSDGTMEFFGRNDSQVKIRGNRVELGEIEHAIISLPEISHVKVIANVEQQYLVAYYMSQKKLPIEYFQNSIKEKLPEYMLPHYFVFLEKFPLNFNGKIDKKALPLPEFNLTSSNYCIAPNNTIEAELVSVYKDVLKKQVVGIRDDFFELGGDSIKAIQVVSRLKRRGYVLKIQDILQYPVIEVLTLYVSAVTRLINQDELEGEVSLGPIQKKFLYNKLLINKHHYNQSVLLNSNSKISFDVLQIILNKIVSHHDVLRSIFIESANGWHQYIEKGKKASLTLIQVNNQDELSNYCEIEQAAFNLKKGPLFKAILFRGFQSDKLFLIAHHLIIDGVSWRILFEDLSSLYRQAISNSEFKLPLKTDSFRSWQTQLNEYATSDQLEKEYAYWHAIDLQSVQKVPLDFPEELNYYRDTTEDSLSLDKDTTNKLLTQCYKAYHTSVNDILLTAFSVAFNEIFNIDKFLIKLEGHGRENINSEIDITRTVGWFTSHYPVLFDMKYNNTIIRQLIDIKEVLHRVPNKGIGYNIFEHFVGEKFENEPEIIFNYLGDFGTGVKPESGSDFFSFSKDYKGREISPDMIRDSLLDVSGIIVESSLNLSIIYSKKQYSLTTINRLLSLWKKNINELVDLLSSSKNSSVTPVDLTFKDLNFETLEAANKKFDIEDVYLLSPLQEGLYYHWIKDTSSRVYFEQMSFVLKGKIDILSFEQSYKTLVSRHAALRTTFTHDLNEKLLQIVREDTLPNFEFIDLRFHKNISSSHYKELDKNKAFDLHNGSQMRLTILRLEESVFEFIWSFHHILMDGWCIGVLINEFFLIYNNISQKEEVKISKIYPYSSYIEWLNKIDKKATVNFWKEYLLGYEGYSSLTKNEISNKSEYRHEEIELNIDNHKRNSIRKLCSEISITENIFFQTLWGVLLCKYNNVSDIVFGSVVSGRPGDIEGIEQMIGLFTNTIPVRISYVETDSFIELLKKNQQSAINGTNHHYIQLAEILSGHKRILFDHIVAFENFPIQEMIRMDLENGNSGLESFSLQSCESFNQTNYDLNVIIFPGETIQIKFKFNGNCFDKSLITRLSLHLINLLEGVISSPGSSIKSLGYLSEQEVYDQHSSYDKSLSVEYDKERDIVDYFEEQVLLHPDTIAISHGSLSLTYRELDAQSSRLSRYLHHHYNLTPEDLIGIELPRSEWMIICMLGILKSNCAYLPIDPTYPSERISYMKTDSGCKVTLDKTELEKFQSEESRYSSSRLDRVASLNHLAYVIYTSGTTGYPKGSLIEHRNVVRLFKTSSPLFDFNEKDVWTLFHSYCFDFSVWEIYGALLFGGRLVIVPSDTSKDPDQYLRLLKSECVTVLNQTPSSFYNLIRQELSEPVVQLQLRYVIFGGEALQPVHLRDWYFRYPSTKLVNMYGITETTVHVTYKEITESEIISNISNIGQAIPTLGCYILDSEQQLLPIGVYGELYVGGAGVCRGYLNRPDLTSERFVKNPFKAGDRLYRSGDKARFLPNGDIEYGGRIDEQVKIRGYRIELGEIEALLNSHEGIDTSVVLCKEDGSGEKTLVAYFISTMPHTTSELRSYLSKSLPSYMLPSYYVQLDSFPLTSNGKLDKKLLPAPGDMGTSSGVEYVEPRNEIEIKLVGIWSDILEIQKENIGIKNDFFELGGDSIKILRVSSEIKKRFNIQVSISDLYNNSTIEKLVNFISENKNSIDLDNEIYVSEELRVTEGMEILKSKFLNSLNSTEKNQIEDVYPMSEIETGMVFESILNKEACIYHDQFFYQRNFVEFNIDLFKKALQLVVDKHSILRTGFNLDEFDREIQIVYSEIDIPLDYENLSMNDSAQQKNIIEVYMKAELDSPFNFNIAPLWRMKAFNLSRGKIGFVWQFHHAILDGWSNTSFITELNNVYLKLCDDLLYIPKKLKSSYKDFIIEAEVLKKDKNVISFWKNELSEYNRLDMFLDTELLSYHSLTLDNDYFRKIENATINIGSTIKIVSLAAYLLMLKALNYGNEVLAGLVTNTRSYKEDGDKVLGCFLNSVPLKITIESNVSCIGFIKQVKDKLNYLKKNEGLSLFEISKIINDKSVFSNPFFDVLFNYVDFHVLNELNEDSKNDMQIDETIHINPYERTNTYFDFTVNTTDKNYTINIKLTRELKSKFSVIQIEKLYLNILNYLVANPTKLLLDIDYQGDESKDLLLNVFNNNFLVYESGQTLSSIFERQVLLYPDAISLRYKDIELSYKALNEKSNRLSSYLLTQYELSSQDLISIKLPRSDWQIISILAVLKSGCAYVPIDIDYPSERVDYIMKDSSSKLLIDEKEITNFIINEDDCSSENRNIPINTSDLAYVIYTSGTTGQPKGVMVEQGSVINLIESQKLTFGIGNDENILQFSNISFDASVEQIFLALGSGSCLTIIDKEELLSPQNLENFIFSNKITHLHAIPSLLKTLTAKKYPSLRRVISGGDTCSKELAAIWFPYHSFYNEYGPTETTVTSIMHLCSDISESGTLPIGIPIANTQVYILDIGLNLVPLGVVGDIYIGGLGLSRGYLNRPELTKEKFLSNPFSPGTFIYKTGDLGRWHSDGTIEFAGRQDDQVKIRGHRIELGEIENTILEYEGISTAVVLAKSTSSEEKELIAYIDINTEKNSQNLRAYLLERLPSYMVPSYYIMMTSFPMNSNGKIDRKQLPSPKGIEMLSGVEYEAPRTETEVKVVEIWSEILDRLPIGIKDDFFELGGHSLKATRLLSQIHKRFEVKLELRDLFTNTTIEKQADLIDIIKWQKKDADKSIIDVSENNDTFSF